MLAGNVRGVLLKGWADNLRLRFGDAFLADVHRLIDNALPEDPQPTAWYPVALQIAVTEHIVNVGFGGNEAAAIEALIEDGARYVDRKAMLAARWLGPGRVIGYAGKLHAHIYDVGTCAADVTRKRAEISWRGADLFGHPTWRLLNEAAVRGVLLACGRNGQVHPGVGSPSGYSLAVSW